MAEFVNHSARNKRNLIRHLIQRAKSSSNNFKEIDKGHKQLDLNNNDNNHNNNTISSIGLHHNDLMIEQKQKQMSEAVKQMRQQFKINLSIEFFVECTFLALLDLNGLLVSALSALPSFYVSLKS